MSNAIINFREALNSGRLEVAREILETIRPQHDANKIIELELLLELQANNIDYILKIISEIENNKGCISAELMRIRAECFRRTARTLEATRTAFLAHQKEPSIDTAFTLAECLQTEERFEEAIEYLRVILKDINSVPVRLRLASCLRRLDRTDEAIEQYQAILQTTPNDTESWYGLSACYASSGNLDVALGFIEDAHKKGVKHPHLLNLKASILERQEKYTESNYIYRDLIKDLRINPTLTSAAWSEFAVENDRQALTLFREAADCYKPPNFKDFAAVRAGGVPVAFEAFKVKHDFEQMQWLSSRGLLAADYMPLMSAYGEVLGKVSEEQAITIKEKTDLWDLALKWHERLAYVYPVRVPKNVLNPKLPYTEIEEAYLRRKPPVIVVDDFLTDEAVEELRTFCFATTGFRRAYKNGYLGIFMESGFANPLILKLAREFCAAFPRIVLRSRLHQAWAFKYDSNMKGINMHADFAKINANFWITPTDGNLLPGKGGMIIYDVPAPKNWTFEDYNSKSDKMRDFLKENNAKAWRVPYKQNRCVFFDSTLFHETDEVRFVDSYEQRRINVTLLFGKGLRDDLL